VTASMLQILAFWFAGLMLGVPMVTSMGLAAFAFVALNGMPVDIVPQKLAQSVNSFPLLAAPLFVLMGNIMNSSGITDRIFTFATACVGWVRGGLCHANILASVIFAGMSGSAVADAGGVGSLEIRAMKKEGYDAETAAAITAASATIGPIIPPSLPMVIYGVSADVSIGGLFLAGIIPGLLMALSLSAMVTVVAKRRGLARHPFPGFGDLWTAYKRAHWALMTPVILFGGIRARLVPVDCPHPSTRDAINRRQRRPSADVSVGRQPRAAVHRLLHGSAGSNADPDPDPHPDRRATRDRSDPVRPDLRPQPDDRHYHAARRRRSLHHLEDRRNKLRSNVARDRALADPTAGRARGMFAVAAVDYRPAELLSRPVNWSSRTGLRASVVHLKGATAEELQRPVKLQWRCSPKPV
jgi:hypothetical protein